MKLFLKNLAFNIAHKIAIKNIKKIVKKTKTQPSEQKNGKKIIFDMIYGMYGQLIYWEGTLAKALQLRGHNVKVLTCGKALTMCTSEYTVQRLHNQETCNHCVKFSSEFLNTANLPYNSYKDYLTNAEIQKIHEKVNQMTKEECQTLVYKNVDVGLLSKNAAMRYFKGQIQPDEKQYLNILRAETINSLIAIDVAEKILKKEKPDILVTTHLGYSSWGGFAEYLAQHGVSISYPGGGYKKDVIGFDFNIRGDTDLKFRKYYEKHRKKQPLNTEEDQELQKFLDRRFKGKEGDTATYGYADQDVKDQFDTKKYKLTYGIFPNVAWDASLLSVHTAFKDIYEWLTYTIEVFKEKPDYQLLIKIHPGEISNQSENTIHDFIKHNFKELPENIKIIPLGTDISPYKLFQVIDIGLVYNGTAGLEMTLQGLPVIVAGLARYGKKGFTYDVKTKEEYKKTLFKKLPKLSDEQIQKARVYAYFYFVKGFLNFPYVLNQGFLKQGWNIESFDELSEGKDENLDKICDYITKDDILRLVK
jgi:hypothetical protein